MRLLLFTCLGFISLTGSAQSDCYSEIAKLQEEHIKEVFATQVEYQQKIDSIEHKNALANYQALHEKQRDEVQGRKNTRTMVISMILATFFFLTTILFLILFIIKLSKLRRVLEN